MTEENFHQVVNHFLVMRINTERELPAGGDSWHTRRKRGNALMEERWSR